MDEFKTDEAAEMPQGSASSPRWTGAPSIALAHAFYYTDLCEVMPGGHVA
jgi:hypothetical protein